MLCLFEMRKTKVGIPISQILNNRPVIMWGRWKDVDSLNNTLNKAKFKISFFCFFKFNITSDLVSGFLGEGLDNCYLKCYVTNADREKTINFSKEKA